MLKMKIYLAALKYTTITYAYETLNRQLLVR